jgi:hypothetical protein
MLPWEIVLPTVNVLLLVDGVAFAALDCSSHDHFAGTSIKHDIGFQVLLLEHAVTGRAPPESAF